MAKKKDKPVEPKPLSAMTVSKSLGVNARTVARWFENGCPRTTIDEVIQWRAANCRPEMQRPHMSKKVAAPPGAIPEKPQGERSLTLPEKRMLADTEKIEAEVRWKNLRYAEKAQNLVSRSVVLREVAELVVRVKERILAAPDEFETRFPLEVRAQCKADFEEFVRLLLWELSQWEILGDPMDDVILAAAESIKAKRLRDAMTAVSGKPADPEPESHTA